MCGLAGIVECSQGWQRDALETLLRTMGRSLRHRGPDDSGTWCAPEQGVGLAHQRLAILDLSPHGHQPMQSRNQRYVLAYNGEIYNFRPLRARLEQAGVSFCGNSDTEVLLEAVALWGFVPTLSELNGMFALALWDRHERRLYLARDRLGEKPLYYGWIGSALVFASELRAIECHPGFAAELDPDAAAMYFTRNYVPGPRSIYAQVRKLMPGHWLQFEPANGRGELISEPYWSVVETAEQGLSQPLDGGDADVLRRVSAQIDAAVASRLEADVPVGALLSGGIDSSLIAAHMQAHSRQRIKTYCVGFDDKQYDESVHARRVAEHLGADHTELLATPGDALNLVTQLPFIYDEPFADCSQLATHLIARLAREHVTVVLTGDGGDELFAGYNRYVWADRVWRWFGRLPVSLRKAIAAVMTTVSPQRIDALSAMARPLVPARLRFDNPGDRVHKLAGLLGAQSSQALYGCLLSNLAGHRAPASAQGVDPDYGKPRAGATPMSFANWMVSADMQGYLPDDILVKVDRATMAVGLESRAPMLDHDLVALSWRLPQRFKLRDGAGKWITRQLLYEKVPRALVDRPKTGFAVPIDAWLRGPLREWAQSLLGAQTLSGSGLIDVAHVRRRWDEHLSGRRNWSHFIWSVLMFEAWRVRTKCPGAVVRA